MRITLMRAPTCPDRTGDHGINTFRYAFYPHKNDWRYETVQKALAFNVLPVAKFNKEAVEGPLAADSFIAKTSKKNVIIDAIKKAQDGNGYIIRVVEEEQNRGKCRIDLGFGFERVIECNMIEEDKNEIPCDASGFEFTIKPFEVKTFRVI